MEDAAPACHLPRPMNLADVFTVVLSVAGVLTVFVGWWLAIAGLFPRLVEGCADRLGTVPLKCFLVGLAGAVPLILGVVVLGKISTNPAAKLLSVALAMIVLLLALAGTAGLAWRIGREPPAFAIEGGVYNAASALNCSTAHFSLRPAKTP